MTHVVETDIHKKSKSTLLEGLCSGCNYGRYVDVQVVFAVCSMSNGAGIGIMCGVSSVRSEMVAYVSGVSL